MSLAISILLAALASYPPGQVVERIACETDPSQTYALYLPSSYDGGRAWPIVFLMDPRGRALVPLELFREAAERHGYILASSYDTLSDGPPGPNEKAMRAMLPDVQSRFSIDTRRIHFAGFSGTARVAWIFGYGLKGSAVAGLIGFGGALPEGLRPAKDPPFAFFGAAGTQDFNYEEMQALDGKLDALGITHRIVDFDGPHAWPPQPVCAEALDWMELQAIRSGKRAVDDALVAALFEERSAEARKLEQEGDPYGALVRYRAIAEDFTGLRDVAAIAARADSLDRSKTVKKERASRSRATARQKEFEARLYAFIEESRTAPTPIPLKESLYDLRIEALKRDAGQTEDRITGDGAKRLLALALASTAFYEPRDHLANGDPARALAVLRVAEAIEPDSPQVCYNLARALAQLDRKAEAVESLERAARSGVLDAGTLEADPYLDPVREETRYIAIIERLKSP